MSTGFDLHEIQMLVWRLVTAPEGVARGAEALREEGALPSTELGSLLLPSATLSATERLDVYADMYFYRLRDCLAEDFPNLARWIGPQRFHNLVTDFLLVHPSRHPSLRELGRPLPSFLEGSRLPRSYALAAPLAALEWARVDVFDDRDAEPLTREALLAGAGGDPEISRVGLVPAVRLLHLPGGVLPLWRSLEDGERPPTSGGSDPGAPAVACVWRRDFSVLHRSLEPDEARWLLALAREPLTLAGLGELVMREAASEQEAGSRLAQVLDRWTAEGLLCFAPDGSPG